MLLALLTAMQVLSAPDLSGSLSFPLSPVMMVSAPAGLLLADSKKPAATKPVVSAAGDSGDTSQAQDENADPLNPGNEYWNLHSGVETDTTDSPEAGSTLQYFPTDDDEY